MQRVAVVTSHGVWPVEEETDEWRNRRSVEVGSHLYWCCQKRPPGRGVICARSSWVSSQADQAAERACGKALHGTQSSGSLETGGPVGKQEGWGMWGRWSPHLEGLVCSTPGLICDLGGERKLGRVLRWGVVLADVKLLVPLLNYFWLSFLGPWWHHISGPPCPWMGSHEWLWPGRHEWKWHLLFPGQASHCWGKTQKSSHPLFPAVSVPDGDCSTCPRGGDGTEPLEAPCWTWSSNKQ